MPVKGECDLFRREKTQSGKAWSRASQSSFGKGEINLQLLMRKLGELGIDSVLIEGGGTLNEDALQSGIVNEVKAFIAPKIFGGRGGKTPVEGFGIEKVDDAIKLQLMRISQVGEDILAEYKVLEEM